MADYLNRPFRPDDFIRSYESSEVRKAGDQSNNVTKLFRNKKGIKTNIKPKKLHTTTRQNITLYHRVFCRISKDFLNQITLCIQTII